MRNSTSNLPEFSHFSSADSINHSNLANFLVSSYFAQSSSSHGLLCLFLSLKFHWVFNRLFNVYSHHIFGFWLSTASSNVQQFCQNWNPIFNFVIYIFNFPLQISLQPLQLLCPVTSKAWASPCLNNDLNETCTSVQGVVKKFLD